MNATRNKLLFHAYVVYYLNRIMGSMHLHPSRQISVFVICVLKRVVPHFKQPLASSCVKSAQYIYTAQQKLSMDFMFVLILVRICNNFFEVINKYGHT